MIEFNCPTCGFKMRAPESAAGKRGPCKKCGSVVTVPGGATPVVETTAVTVVSPSPQPPAVVPGPARATAVSPVVRRLTNDEQDPAVVEKIVAKVQDLLMTGEELRYVAVQQRPVANFAPDAIVLTSKRFMWFKTKLLGRYDFVDFVWREVRDAKITEGMLGATISITTQNQRLTVDYLPKRQAREVYRFAQEMEEVALEERRQRMLEEKRAASGGTTVAVQTGPLHAPTADADPLAKLTQLKKMLDAGLITQDEYDAKKASLLAAM